MVSAWPPTSRTSAATSSSSFLVPEASKSLPPRAPSVIAQPRPKAPEAPVMTATLLLTSNRESGWRSASEIISRSSYRPVVPAKAGTHNPRFLELSLHVPHCNVGVHGSPLSRGRQMRSSPGLETERLLRIEHRQHAQRAAFALRPAPREGKEGAALAGDGVEVAA